MHNRSTSRRRFLRTLAAPSAAAGTFSGMARTRAAEPTPGKQAGESHRCGLWIDLCSGEPVTEEELLGDLASVQVAYLGERHSVQRHHDWRRGLSGNWPSDEYGLCWGWNQWRRSTSRPWTAMPRTSFRSTILPRQPSGPLAGPATSNTSRSWRRHDRLSRRFWLSTSAPRRSARWFAAAEWIGSIRRSVASSQPRCN